jgi:predicted Zn-dependent peptidase
MKAKKVLFFKKKLKNGITVILEERKNSGVISLAFAVKHGGIHEDKEIKGISHFIEHMLYKGTKKRNSKEISLEIEGKGGILNGFTEEEITAYWCKLPSEYLKTGLEVLGDMINNSKFDEKEMDKERKVILEEIKMRRDTPQIRVYDEIQSLLYRGNLGLEIVGTPESLNSINREKIIKKFREVYTTNNLLLCAVGEVDFKTLCGFCEKNFSKSFKEIKSPRVELNKESRIEKQKGIGQVNLIFAHHTSKAGTREAYTAQVLNALLAGSMSSRLWQEIREKRNLAYAVKGSAHLGRNFGYNTIYVGTSPENLELVKKIIVEEFKKLGKLGKKEFESAKTQLIGNSRIGREDSQGQMLDLLLNEVATKAEDSYMYEQNISKVKIEEVKKLAEKAINNFSILVLMPENE